MCGISGFFDASGTKEQLAAMLQTLEHRGPDHAGLYFSGKVGLAHNRLSIIDLSERANQPLFYRHVVIVLNGEIYNYIELRHELEKQGYFFATSSDSEVAAAAYLAWGEQCVEHFIGMWAFAVWDKQKNLLFCSCDRFGIKPFYYIHEDSRFYFGSEYKPLKKSPIFQSKINERQIMRGLKLGWAFYESETYFDCLRRLPAAHNLTFDGRNLNIYRYWDIDLSRKLSQPQEQRFNRFRELFADSVKLQLRSDVSIGACLSGGIDSSSIVSMASHLAPDIPMHTFTIFYAGREEVDERPWVNEVTCQYPNLLPHFFQPSSDELADAFENAQFHADVPLPGSSYLSQCFVMQLAAQNGMKVLLDGQGSDEYLAGYLHSYDRLLGDTIRNFQFKKALKTLIQQKNIHRQSWRQTLYVAAKCLISGFNDENSFYRHAYKYKFPDVFAISDSSFPFELNHQSGASRFDDFLYHQVFHTSLPTLLHFEDRNSMAFGIESRVPFLDHRLVEFVFSLDDEDKISQGETKHILRHALQGILPAAISERLDKKGFVTPGEEKWLRGPLRHLLEIDFKDYDFIDDKKVTRILNAYRKGAANSVFVWRLAALHNWLKNL